MKAIMVMFDSLNRRYLPNYGNDWIKAPNFERLGRQSVTFDTSYAGSLPCMPARRELHTGRYNFLHRAWGPIEPFDDSMPEMLSKKGVHTHLVSDHVHYWEDGGATYHQRYSTWEIVRGQEGDHWKGYAGAVEEPEHGGRWWKQDWVNRRYTATEAAAPQTNCFDLGLEFIEANKDNDDWFLQIETFDPHEPFVSPDSYLEGYESGYAGRLFDWPDYKPVSETPEEVAHVRNKYAALLSMCDRNLGRVLDTMDRFDLWKDTMLIVNTDHGFLLGEHGWWAKCVQPFYEEVARTPLFIWDPRSGVAGERRKALVQTIDLAPTLLKFFGLDPTRDMLGADLAATVAGDAPVRESGLFGMFGGHVNCVWGDYVFMRAPIAEKGAKPYNYTLMPTHMRNFFSIDELRNAEFGAKFSFTKGCPVMRTPGRFGAPGGEASAGMKDLLFDLSKDPAQEHPIRDERVEAIMLGLIRKAFVDNDAPAELYGLYGL